MSVLPRSLLAILILGLVARLMYVVWYPQQPVAHDAEGYDTTAVALVNTGHYPAFGRAPVYPTFLAGVFWVFGHSYPHVRVVQAVLVSLTALFGFLLGRDLFGHREGLIAGGIASVYPGFFAYAGLLLTETLFALLVTAFTWCVVQMWRGGGPRWAVASGVTLGLATLCRGEIIGVAVPAAALLAWKGRSPFAVRGAILFLLATALTITPWTVRQYANRDEGVVFTGGIGATLWLSTYPGEWLEWYPEREPLRSLIDCQCSGEELDQLLIDEAIRNVMDSPAQYAWMSVKRFGRFWIGSHSNVMSGLESSFQAAIARGDTAVLAAKGLLLILNVGLLVVAAIGLYIKRASWNVWLPLLLVIGYVNLVHVGLFSTSRYQIPIMPLVAVFAACASDRFVVRLRAEKMI